MNKTSFPPLQITSPAVPTIYERVIQPEQQVLLSGYLRWHLQRLSPEAGWLYVAAAVLGSGPCTLTELAALCGQSPESLLPLLNDPQFMHALQGLLTVSQSQETLHLTVTLPPPLIPADAERLKKWLRIREACYPSPQEVLAAACRAPLQDFFIGFWDMSPEDLKPYENLPPQTVREIVTDLYGEMLSAMEREVLIARLQAHLFPLRNPLRITHYFMKHILPYMDPGAAWLLTLQRNQWQGDLSTRSAVPLTTVWGGNTELAGYLGTVRPDMVEEWLQPGMPLSLYLRDMTSDPEEEGYTFAVLMEEIPGWLMAVALDEKTWAHCRALLERAAAGENLPPAQWQRCTRRLRLDTPPLEMPVGVEMARLLLELGETVASCDVSLSSEPGVLPETWGQSGPRHLFDTWNWAVLFACNPEIDADNRTWLLENEVPPGDFVAWMMYAAKNEIQNPARFAVQRLRKRPGRGPGRAFEPFRWMQPAPLRELLGNPERQALHWADVMGNNPEPWAALIPRLFGSWEIVG